MFIDFLTPPTFDAIIVINIALGLMLALRRFVMDLRRPLPDEAPAWAHESSQMSEDTLPGNRQ